MAEVPDPRTAVRPALRAHRLDGRGRAHQPGRPVDRGRRPDQTASARSTSTRHADARALCARPCASSTATGRRSGVRFIRNESGARTSTRLRPAGSARRASSRRGCWCSRPSPSRDPRDRVPLLRRTGGRPAGTTRCGRSPTSCSRRTRRRGSTPLQLHPGQSTSRSTIPFLLKPPRPPPCAGRGHGRAARRPLPSLRRQRRPDAARRRAPAPASPRRAGPARRPAARQVQTPVGAVRLCAARRRPGSVLERDPGGAAAAAARDRRCAASGRPGRGRRGCRPRAPSSTRSTGTARCSRTTRTGTWASSAAWRRASTGSSSQVDEAIVLEDDCVPDPPSSASARTCSPAIAATHASRTISGTTFDSRTDPDGPSYRYSRYPLIWGWATWRRAWRGSYDAAMSRGPSCATRAGSRTLFDDPMRSRTGRAMSRSGPAATDTPGTRLAARLLDLHGGLAVVPDVNLVTNVGFGADATQPARMTCQPVREPADHEPIAFPLATRLRSWLTRRRTDSSRRRPVERQRPAHVRAPARVRRGARAPAPV